MSDPGPHHGPIVSGDVSYHKSELGGYVSEGGSYLNEDQARRIRIDQLEAELASTGSTEKNPSPSTPVDFSGFGRFMTGAAKVALVVALPVIGFNVVKNAWTDYQQKSSPDLSVVIGAGGQYYSAKGLTGAEAERTALATCKSAGSSYCNVGATVSSKGDFCISTMRNKRSGIHVFETVTDPNADPLRKLREESISGYEQTGKKGTEWTNVSYFCNTDSMANKFASSAVLQQDMTARENAKTQALHEARTDIKAIPSGAYVPRTVPIRMLDGPSDRLRVKEEINDKNRCIWVFNGEAGFDKARVRVLGHGDKVVGGLINKQDLEPDTKGLCAEDVLKMQQRADGFSLRPPTHNSSGQPSSVPAPN